MLRLRPIRSVRSLFLLPLLSAACASTSRNTVSEGDGGTSGAAGEAAVTGVSVGGASTADTTTAGSSAHGTSTGNTKTGGATTVGGSSAGANSSAGGASTTGTETTGVTGSAGVGGAGGAGASGSDGSFGGGSGGAGAGGAGGDGAGGSSSGGAGGAGTGGAGTGGAGTGGVAGSGSSATGGGGSTTTATGGTTGTTPCSDDPCVNGGRCIVVEDSYVCDCLEGFGPPNCSVDIDECADNDCENGATCVDGIAEYTCECLDGYEGELCEDETDECEADPCQNGGECSDEFNDFTCGCVNNWGGKTCSVKLFEGLDMPATYTASRARAVSDDGTTVVGELTGAAGTRAFYWNDGELVVLDSDNAVATVNAVNADGSFIVGSTTATLQEGAYWLDEDFETIYSPSASSTSVANAVNEDGWLIAGTCQSDGFPYACRWTNRLASGQILSGASEESEAWDVSADGSIIVGRYGFDPFRAFRWSEADGWVRLMPLSGDDSTWAEVISGDGSVIYGTSELSGGTDERAVRWVDGSTEAESLSFGARIHATNHDGSVIAGHLFVFNSDPFIWDAANGTRALFDALVEAGADMTGWSGEFVEGISADGRTFVGYATHDGVTEAFIARLP